MGWRTYFIGLGMKFLLITTSWEFQWITKCHRLYLPYDPSVFIRSFDCLLCGHCELRETCAVVVIYFFSRFVNRILSIQEIRDSEIVCVPNSTSTNYSKDFTIRCAFKSYAVAGVLCTAEKFIVHKWVCAEFMRKNETKAIIVLFSLLLSHLNSS